MFEIPWISILMLLSLVAGVGSYLARSFAIPLAAWTWGMGVALLVVVSGMMWVFDATQPGFQLVEQYRWIPSLGIQYQVGVDGISMGLVVLTTWMHVLVILASSTRPLKDEAFYRACLFLSLTMMLGVFVALDGMLFYVFWEAMLIPMFLLVGIWGASEKVYAAQKLFVFTFSGSVLMLLALLQVATEVQSFDIQQWVVAELSHRTQWYIALAMILAFAIKVPMFPVHTWLPDVHTQAPTGGSAILASVMLKAGGYGLMRLVLPLCPVACRQLAVPMVVLSVVAVVYVGLVALAQKDIKRLIAYASIAHMGIVTAGLFAGMLMPLSMWDSALLAYEGAYVQMIAHGFGSAALFLAFGMLYDRLGTRQIADMSGLAVAMPGLAGLFMLFALSNLGLPGTAGFVGEFMVTMGLMPAGILWAAAVALTMVIAPAYTLWLYHRVFYGQRSAYVQGKVIGDLQWSEWAVLGVLAGGIIIIGIFPGTILTVLDPQAQAWLKLSWKI